MLKKCSSSNNFMLETMKLFVMEVSRYPAPGSNFRNTRYPGVFVKKKKNHSSNSFYGSNSCYFAQERKTRLGKVRHIENMFSASLGILQHTTGTQKIFDRKHIVEGNFFQNIRYLALKNPLRNGRKITILPSQYPTLRKMSERISTNTNMRIQSNNTAELTRLDEGSSAYYARTQSCFHRNGTYVAANNLRTTRYLRKSITTAWMLSLEKKN